MKNSLNRIQKSVAWMSLAVLVLVGFLAFRESKPAKFSSDSPTSPQSPPSDVAQHKTLESHLPADQQQSQVPADQQHKSEILTTETLSDTQARLKLDFPTLKLTDVTLEDGITYQMAHLPQTGLLPLGEGRPTLPMKTLMIGIPPGAEFDVQLASEETTRLKDVFLAPAERLVKMNAADSESLFTKDEAFYATDENFPADPLCSARRVSLRDREFVEIRLAPLRYNPAKRELEVSQSVSLEMEIFPTAGDDAPAEDPLHSAAFEMLLTEGDYSFPGYTPTNVVYPGGVGPEKYMIIYNEQFQDNPHFQEFIEWKRRKGYEVVLKTTKSIGGSHCSASEISSYLKGLPDEEWPTYLLMVGNDSKTTGAPMYRRLLSYNNNVDNDHFYSLRTTNQELNEEWGEPSKIMDWSNGWLSPDGTQVTVDVPYDTWGFESREVEPGDLIWFEGSATTTTVASVDSNTNLTLVDAVLPGATNLNFSIDLFANFNPANWLDEYPDLFVGRIPANDNAMLSSMLEKMMLMDRNPPESGAHYNRNILVGAKDGALNGPEPQIDALGVYFEREYGNSSVERAFNGGDYDPGQWVDDPGSMLWSNEVWQPSDGFVAKNCSSNADAKEKLKREWGEEEGAALVHYICHGGATAWYWNNNGSDFTRDDAAVLNTPERFSFVMDYSCDTAGWISGTNFTQTLLCNPNGGAYSMISAAHSQWGAYQDFQFYGYLSGVFTNWFEFYTDAFEEGVDDNTVTYPAFADPTLPITYSPGHAPRMGQMWWCGKLFTLENFPADGLVYGGGQPNQPVATRAAYDNMIMQTLFGDPEAFMVFSAPTPLAATVPATVGTGAGTVQINTEEGAQVALYSDALDIHLVDIADTNGVASFDIAPAQAGAVAVTASKFGRVPFEGGFAVGANTAPAFSQSDIFQTTVKAAESCEDSLATFASDADGDDLKFSILSGPGWLKILDNGTYYGTPDFSDIGNNEFTVQVEDDSGASDTATMTIIVNPNDAANTTPYANQDPILLSSTLEDGISGSLTNHVFDDEGDALSFTKTSGATWLTVAEDGTLSGFPEEVHLGHNSVDVSVSDGINLAVVPLDIFVSPAEGLLMVYEGFDYESSSKIDGLNGGAGFSSAWISSQAGVADEYFEVVSSGESWGSLPVSGNRLKRINTGGQESLSRTLSVDLGVADLWFSVLWRPRSNEGFAIGSGALQKNGGPPDTINGGAGFGFMNTDDTAVYASIYHSGGRLDSSTGIPITQDTLILLAGHVEFNVGASGEDRLSLHPVATDLTLGTPVTVEADLDETLLNTLTIESNRSPGFDEIRLGSSFAAVLGITSPPSEDDDSDEDGIPDNWEIQYGLNPHDVTDATKDRDGDGFSNSKEYWADTNPTNPVSCLRIKKLSMTNGQLGVDWRGGVNATQYLECKESLFSNKWTSLETFVPPLTTNQSTTVSNVPQGRWFFRIRSAR